MPQIYNLLLQWQITKPQLKGTFESIFFFTSSFEFMLSEHAICCSMCPPLEVKESPKEKGDVILEKKKKKKDCI